MTARTLTLKQLAQGHLDSLGHTEPGAKIRPPTPPAPPCSWHAFCTAVLAHLEECER